MLNTGVLSKVLVQELSKVPLLLRILSKVFVLISHVLSAMKYLLFIFEHVKELILVTQLLESDLPAA